MTTEQLQEQTDIFNEMTSSLDDADKQWLHCRFVEDKSLDDAAKIFNVAHAATHEQRIMRKMRRVSVPDRIFDLSRTER